jgi:cytidylate kinase
MAQELRLTRPEAAEEVRARDDRRALFLERTLGLDHKDLTAYDAVVNSERLGVETAAQFIGWAVRTKQMFTEIAEEPAVSLGSLDELAGA